MLSGSTMKISFISGEYRRRRLGARFQAGSLCQAVPVEDAVSVRVLRKNVPVEFSLSGMHGSVVIQVYPCKKISPELVKGAEIPDVKGSHPLVFHSAEPPLNLGFGSGCIRSAVTMMRLNLVKGLGPVVQIVEGCTVKLPDEVSDVLMERTNPTWPCTWFAPRTTGEGAFKTAYDVMNNWGANHGAISYGHIGADLITVCSMLRIPVCMHNVPEEKIFRPAAWNAFGMDKEGADYRACETYGPLYRS